MESNLCSCSSIRLMKIRQKFTKSNTNDIEQINFCMQYSFDWMIIDVPHVNAIIGATSWNINHHRIIYSSSTNASNRINVMRNNNENDRNDLFYDLELKETDYIQSVAVSDI